jgi:hypothetical protein
MPLFSSLFSGFFTSSSGRVTNSLHFHKLQSTSDLHIETLKKKSWYDYRFIHLSMIPLVNLLLLQFKLFINLKIINLCSESTILIWYLAVWVVVY